MRGGVASKRCTVHGYSQGRGNSRCYYDMVPVTVAIAFKVTATVVVAIIFVVTVVPML